MKSEKKTSRVISIIFFCMQKCKHLAYSTSHGYTLIEAVKYFVSADMHPNPIAKVRFNSKTSEYHVDHHLHSCTTSSSVASNMPREVSERQSSASVHRK